VSGAFNYIPERTKPSYSRTTLAHEIFQVLTAASMKFRFFFWDVLPCKIIVILMMEAARTSEASVDNYLYNSMQGHKMLKDDSFFKSVKLHL
jgi:membrane-associated PAP2 superfamily phosphatase